MARSKTIGIVLSLKDKFSKGFTEFNNKAKLTEKETKRVQNRVKNFISDAEKSFVRFSKRGVTAIGALGTAAAGISIKKGFSEAFDLEGYRSQLETATKSTKKAADIMKYSINLANKTPFEGGELVEAASKFEAMGMSAKKWLTLTGDMAGATNKSFDQATEALIDAQQGELERLKQFGIKKVDIAKKANELFAGQEVVNSKGQIQDQEKFNQALIALMQDRYKGGMNKLAKTSRGLWSTVTGVTKNALANIVGIGNDGVVRQGSALDYVKNKIGELADKMSQWQNDGTLERITKKADLAFKKFVSGTKTVAKGIAWIARNANWLIPIVAGLVTGLKAMSVLRKIHKWIVAIKMVMKVGSIFSLVTSIGGVAIVIGIVVAGLIALVLNWKKVKKWALDAIHNIQKKFSNFKKALHNVKTPQWIISIHDWFVRVIDKAQQFANFVRDKISKIKPPEWLSNAVGWVSDKISGHALGTSYFAGGRTLINEGGRGEEVILPSGTRIIPHDIAKYNYRNSKQSVSVNVHINGNVIGNQEYADYIGNTIINKLMAALDNS